MAGRDVGHSVAGRDSFVADYVADLASRLRGPRGRRRRILDEIADGLLEAVSDRRAAGYSDEEAESSAVRRFGEPPVVAEAFREELLAASARRVCGWLLITGPIVGATWLLALSITPWEAGLASFLASVPVAPAVGTFVLMGLIVLARTGRLGRWIGDLHPLRARNAARVLAGGCVVVDATMIGLTIVMGHPLTVTIGLAVLLSGARIGCCLLVLWKILSK
jgi:hypothetical protein